MSSIETYASPARGGGVDPSEKGGELGVADPAHPRAGRYPEVIVVAQLGPGARLVGRSWFVPEDFKVTPGTRGPKPKGRK